MILLDSVLGIKEQIVGVLYFSKIVNSDNMEEAERNNAWNK